MSAFAALSSTIKMQAGSHVGGSARWSELPVFREQLAWAEGLCDVVIRPLHVPLLRHR
jgi:hypothetical protein